MVRAPRLEAGALMSALERGDFYASTGVVLDDVNATAKDLAVKVKPEGVSKYRIQFIGRGGRVLSETGRRRPPTRSATRVTCAPRSSRATAASPGCSRCCRRAHLTDGAIVERGESDGVVGLWKIKAALRCIAMTCP